MKVDIYDTHVSFPCGRRMHFDVLVRSGDGKEKALEFARDWLKEAGEMPDSLDQKRCNFCHSESATEEVITSVTDKGYFIIQMEGCPNPV